MSSEDTSTGSVKERLRQALTVAMKARDEVALSALRQALAALAVEEIGRAHV